MKNIILYHGTRANPDSIRKYGLIAGGFDKVYSNNSYVVNKEHTLQRVLNEFGLQKSDIPDWIYKGELEYEKDLPIHLHLERNFDNARGYADMGGEPAYCIRHNIVCWLIAKFISLMGHDEDRVISEYSREIYKESSEWAKEKNGLIRYVVVVKIDVHDIRIDPYSRQLWDRLEKLKSDNKINDIDEIIKQPSEIRYFGDIEPENIIGIIAVGPPTFV